ncbi:MAG TPA: hypothetical protein VKB07_02525 [Gaiellaceae bacterium]|nr:hypothetical protein [Gaiellaceae bacterium]
MKRLLVVAALSATAFAVAPAPAFATDECRGLQQCVPVHGPWVVIPTGNSVPRPRVEWQLMCPRGYVAAGLDAELSHRAIDVGFLGIIGAPVTPGVATARAVVFYASYVGGTARAPTFRPHVGCMPGGGGGRIPTAFKPGRPTVRRVAQNEIPPGRSAAVKSCLARESLVGASHAFGFFMRNTPSSSLVDSVTGAQRIRGRRVSVVVTADVEVASVQAVVQVHAVCSRVR